jgi:hypothetical protein
MKSLPVYLLRERQPLVIPSIGHPRHEFVTHRNSLWSSGLIRWNHAYFTKKRVYGLRDCKTLYLYSWRAIVKIFFLHLSFEKNYLSSIEVPPFLLGVAGLFVSLCLDIGITEKSMNIAKSASRQRVIHFSPLRFRC